MYVGGVAVKNECNDNLETKLLKGACVDTASNTMNEAYEKHGQQEQLTYIKRRKKIIVSTVLWIEFCLEARMPSAWRMT